MLALYAFSTLRQNKMAVLLNKYAFAPVTCVRIALRIRVSTASTSSSTGPTHPGTRVPGYLGPGTRGRMLCFALEIITKVEIRALRVEPAAFSRVGIPTSSTTSRR